MTFNEIKFEIEDGIAVLTLDNPETRNAVTGEAVIEDIVNACDLVNRDKQVRVMIITAVDPAFSSGGNVKDMWNRTGMFGGSPSEVKDNYKNNVQRIPLAVYNVEVPTIAAVNGPAVGAGCDLTLMCDIRVASEKAKFGESFINVGLVPGDGGAYFLPRVVGMARACEMSFTGDAVDAERALEIGLVNYLVRHEELMVRSMELARKIASRPPAAMRMTKRLLQMGQFLSLPDLLEQSASFQALCHHSEDHREALSAMFEKRKPVYKGR